jgi:hypothetical protein
MQTTANKWENFCAFWEKTDKLFGDNAFFTYLCPQEQYINK